MRHQKMDVKQNNIKELRSFFESRFTLGKIADREEFISENHSFRISGKDVLFIIEITDEVLSNFDFNQILSHFYKHDLFDKISQNPNAHFLVKSTEIKPINPES